jgi:transposase InsO family protein
VTLTGSYPVALVCSALGLHRSSYYYRRHSPGEEAVRAALQDEAETWPRYGYRRLGQELRRKGWQVNPKRVRRLMRQMGLQIKRRGRRPVTTNSRHGLARFPNLIRGLRLTRPDQVWAADVTYVRLRREWVYLAVILDVYTRSIRGWHLGRSPDQELTLVALEKALSRGVPEIHHSDQGVQYAASCYVQRLREAHVKVSMADIGQPTQNPHAERLIRTIKEEEVDLSEYNDFEDAKTQIGHFIEQVYMHKRIHSALGYLTPAEFEARSRSFRGSEAKPIPLGTAS